MVDQFLIGDHRNFIYLITFDGQSLVVDPQSDLKPWQARLRELGSRLTGVLLTHTHWDHVAGLPAIAGQYAAEDVPVYVHELDARRLRGAKTPLEDRFHFVRDGDRVPVGGQNLEVLHTPGHSSGECCYFLKSDGKVPALFTGDTVFIGDVGRCDLESGSVSQMHATLQRLKTLPPDTVIYPGHDYGRTPTSTLRRECENSAAFKCRSIEDSMPSPEQILREQPPGMPRMRGWLSPYRLLIRPLLFRFDAETIHHFVTTLARWVWAFRLGRAVTRAIYMRKLSPMPIKLASVEAPFPLGLAAGFDKNATLLPGVENLGFGFVEVGTVTPRPQLGNPRPRMSRIADKRALLNRMGFNNEGAEIISAHLKRVRDRLRVPVGVNLGKNKDTPNSEAISDYEKLFKAFSLTASYFVVNISSPNTPGLRDLQSGKFVEALGGRILQLRISQPVFVKLAPEVPPDDLKDIAALCGPGKSFAGLVLTNTIGTDLGGLSGFPLKGRSSALLKLARTMATPDTPIVSVGGIETAEDVLERFRLGANAVQLYSGIVYGGPGLPGRILREVQKKMKQKGIRTLTDLRQG